MRILAILTVKNEGAFLLEWLAHHRAIGFDDFLVLSNDCSDGTDAMLDRLAAMGWLTHVHNPAPHPQGPQWAALRLAEKHPLLQRADWVMTLDIDEFVNVHTGARTVPDLLKARPDADAIALSWRLFGNCGVVDYVDRPVTEQFLRAAPVRMLWPWRAALIKTLYRNDGGWRRPGVHRPRGPDPERRAGQRWVDGSGQALPEAYTRGRLFAPLGQDNYQLAQINHYALGAMQSYLLKCDRGRANRDASAFDMSYWVERNFCSDEDRSILDLAPQVSAIRDELGADPQLVALHAGAVAWRHARVGELMLRESFRALFGRLLLTPPSRPLAPEAAAFMAAWGRRAARRNAETIPD